jgi:hypothetical protein
MNWIFACLRIKSLYTTIDELATQARQPQRGSYPKANLFITTQVEQFSIVTSDGTSSKSQVMNGLAHELLCME